MHDLNLRINEVPLKLAEEIDPEGFIKAVDSSSSILTEKWLDEAKISKLNWLSRKIAGSQKGEAIYKIYKPKIDALEDFSLFPKEDHRYEIKIRPNIYLFFKNNKVVNLQLFIGGGFTMLEDYPNPLEVIMEEYLINCVQTFGKPHSTPPEANLPFYDYDLPIWFDNESLIRFSFHLRMLFCCRWELMERFRKRLNLDEADD